MFKGSDLPRPDNYELAVNERDAWVETAAFYAVNADYWKRRHEEADAHITAMSRVLAEQCLRTADLREELARARSQQWK